VPTSGLAALTFKGLPLDELEDLVANSAAYRQTARNTRPGTNRYRREATHTTACWPSWPSRLLWSHQRNFRLGRRAPHRGVEEQKVTTKLTEEEEDGTTVIRERERFVQELSVVSLPGDGHA